MSRDRKQTDRKKHRRRVLKRETKTKLRDEGRDQDPLAMKDRFFSLGRSVEKTFSSYVEHLTGKNRNWIFEGLVNRARETFELLRDKLEEASGDLTWDEPFLELRFPVSIDPARGPVPVADPFPFSEEDFTDESWGRFRKAAREGEHQKDPLFRRTLEAIEAFTQGALELQAFKALTGGTALVKEGEEYTPILLKDPEDELPEDPEERQSAVDALLEERFRPFVLSAPRTPEEGPCLALSGVRDGRPFVCSLVVELHPLVLDADKREAFYPLLVGFVFEGEENPSAWSPKDRGALWAALFKALDELAEGLREGREPEEKTTSETGTIETLAPVVSKPSAETLRRSTMSPIPLPRALHADAMGWAFHRGLAGMFSRYSKVPDLDLHGGAAIEEAEGLFWAHLEAGLEVAAADGAAFTWKRTEQDGRTLLDLRGLSEKDARALWNRVVRSLNKGEGGPGLEVSPPRFEPQTRFEGGGMIEETRLVFWPEEPSTETHAPVRFRTEGSPGYVSLLARHGPRPYFADGWLWIPRGGEREGFRLGGLQTLLFPEGRAALERLAKRQRGDLEGELNRLYRNPSLFRAEDDRAAQDLKAAIRRVEAWLQKLSVYDIGPDLLLCVFEAFHRQRDSWIGERVTLKDGAEVSTAPWRIIRLDPEDLRIRLDPKQRWGRNWRARLFEKLEALTTFERQTRTQAGRKVDVGDRFLTRAIDGRQGVAEGAAPETDSGLGLTRLLRQAGAFPVDAFFVEVSLDFMARLVTWAVDEKGLVRWGIDAAQTAQRAALVSGNADGKQARLLAEGKRQEVRKRPWGEHSPRLLTVANLEEWPETKRYLAYQLLQETTPNFERYRDARGTARKRYKKNRLGGSHALETIAERDFVACNGSNGYGYRVRVWIDKVGYEKRPGPHGGARAFADFVKDLRGLVADLDLRVRLHSSRDRRARPWTKRDKEALQTLEAHRGRPPGAYDLRLKLYLPADLETRLRERLEEAGIDAADEGEEAREPQGLDPVSLRNARRKAGLKQDELAEKVGVVRSLVSAWESGKKPIPQEREARLREVLEGHL